MPKAGELTERQKAFVREYLVDLVATQAAIRAGYSPKTAEQQGNRLLGNAKVAEEIARQTKERHNRLGIDADALLKRAETILTADPRKLTEHHVGACRYCYGLDHGFQWRTEREWNAACAAAEAKKKERPGCEGGFGYNRTKEPCPTCPECDGLGVPYVVFADTRKLTPDALVLYEGVKQTKDGIEIKTASKQAAFDLLAKHKGLMAEQHKHEHTGKDGKPIEHRVKAKVVMVPVKVPAEGSVKPLAKDGDP